MYTILSQFEMPLFSLPADPLLDHVALPELKDWFFLILLYLTRVHMCKMVITNESFKGLIDQQVNRHYHKGENL